MGHGGGDDAYTIGQCGFLIHATRSLCLL
jgi:hypothetical protein